MAGVKGRGSAGHATMAAFVLAIGLLAMAPAAQAVNHIVGGSKWDYAPVSNLDFYQTWASNITFNVGDTLQFEYANISHDVVQYASKTDYDACNPQGTQVDKWTTGNDSIPVAAGTSYYICSFLGHCEEGMKVAISTATAGVAPTPPPVAAPGPESPTAPPPSAASPLPFQSIAGLVAAAFVAALAFQV